MKPTTETRSQALNLALMYQRQLRDNDEDMSDDSIVATAEKFHAFLVTDEA